MQGLLTSSVRPSRRRYRSTGHLGPGRFQAFPVQADDPLPTVLRYVERHPVGAGRVRSARDGPWSGRGR
jgi:putative transposase